jgi:hypothetical protein
LLLKGINALVHCRALLRLGYSGRVNGRGKCSGVRARVGVRNRSRARVGAWIRARVRVRVRLRDKTRKTRRRGR